MPVTIVHNVDDSAVPFEEAERLARAMPTAKLVPIVGIDHVPWGEIDVHPLINEIGDLAARMQDDPGASSVLRALVAVIDAVPEEIPRIRDRMTSCGGGSWPHEGGVIGVFEGVDRARRCASTLCAIMPTARIAVHAGEVVESVRAVKGRPVEELLGEAACACPGKPLLTELVLAFGG